MASATPAAPTFPAAAAARPQDGVVPALAELIALRNLAQGRGAAGRGRDGVSGHALSNLRGRGMEYAESREYAAGDDARHIDWRLTARSGRAHTKLFQAERERLSLVVADTAPALYFGTRTRFKSVQAARVAALAAWVAVRDGDRVAALRGSAGEAPVPPASGARGALRVLDALVRWYAAPPADDTGLADALAHAQRLLRPGARVLVVAEPASVLEVPAARWAAMAMHQDLLAVLPTDPLEQSPPSARRAFSAGAGAAVALDLEASTTRRRWHGEFAGTLETALQHLRGHGARAMALSCAAPSEDWLPLLDQPRRGARR